MTTKFSCARTRCAVFKYYGYVRFPAAEGYFSTTRPVLCVFPQPFAGLGIAKLPVLRNDRLLWLYDLRKRSYAFRLSVVCSQHLRPIALLAVAKALRTDLFASKSSFLAGKCTEPLFTRRSAFCAIYLRHIAARSGVLGTTFHLLSKGAFGAQKRANLHGVRPELEVC